MGKLSVLIVFYIYVYLNIYFIILGLINLLFFVLWIRRKLLFLKFFVRGNMDDVWNKLMISVIIDFLFNFENEKILGV